MKKTKILFIIVLFQISQMFAEQITIYKGEAYHFNEILSAMVKTEFSIKYDTEDKIYYFFSSDFMKKGWIILKEEQLNQFRLTLEKFNDWEAIAIKNKVELEKEFPNSELNCKVSWYYVNDWYHSTGTKMNFKFFSQSKTRHQFIISSNLVTSNSNQFIEYKLETFYLDKNQVNLFINGISLSSIEQAKKKAQNNIEAKKLFN
ncbi:hypothetical protein [Polaribacter sp. HaHaR_3_91]|jgi:hypothetical protein|uniref:hypothetical protein n=1 Tax=Polaribacter sp. HaHaR_3_91 TaxID=2745561 RepID=UPI001C4F4D25|nr:hypothetical protein [Polaribacter sp. HaHaR_3_91]QXP62078.1 hypothetical protein H0I27_09260 [Polaribacter sp. HaHaR_3_91]